MVIDNSSAFRMDPHVPLVVPEVNEDALEGHSGIVLIPNCVAAPLVVALKPIADAVGLERVVVASYQSVSGTGAAAVAGSADMRASSPGRSPSRPSTPPHRVQRPPHRRLRRRRVRAVKVADETRKMLGLPELRVSATTVRVPVLYAHSQAVHVETTDELTADDARNLMMAAPGLVLDDEPAAARYPLPREAASRDDVLVGRRIREDSSHQRGLAMWVVSDNLRKGATNADQIAESLVTRGWL